MAETLYKTNALSKNLELSSNIYYYNHIPIISNQHLFSAKYVPGMVLSTMDSKRLKLEITT